MKKRVQVLIVALTVLAFSGMCFAQAKSETSTPPAKTATKAKASRITGEVTSVDAKAGTLTVKGKDKDVNLEAESKAAKASLGNIKAGDRVRVLYTEKDGKMVASSVTKATKAATKGTPTEKKSETK